MIVLQHSKLCLNSSPFRNSFALLKQHIQFHLPVLYFQDIPIVRHLKIINKVQIKRPLNASTFNIIPSTMADSVKYLDVPDKSETDKKIYKTLLLENGLHALIISDPSPMPHDGFTTSGSSADEPDSISNGSDDDNSASGSSDSSSTGSGDSNEDSDSEVGDEKLAACALCIDYGSFDEPQNYQGLAHFLEHMIFMGSMKYPEENIFDAHIKKCGGFNNAFTDHEETIFYFEVAEKHLDSSLDYFTALMKRPLMKKEAMTRERCAVDSEFQQIVQDDEARRDQLLASLSTPGYPQATFAWGNAKTLKENVDDDDLHQTLHEIRRVRYVANRMHLCVQARLPIDELESLVIHHFADIPRSSVPGRDVSKFDYRQAFLPEFHQQVFFVKPVETVLKLELTWVLPSVRKYYRSKPDHLLAYLFGYEGRGSLCAYLRRHLWSLELISGIDDNGFDLNSIYSLFNVCVYLTDEGFKHLDEVIAAVFGYVKVIANADSKQLRTIFDEQQGIEATNFRFQPQRPAMDNVQELLLNTKHFPPKDVLTGKELFYEYNEDHLTELIAHINDFKFNLMVTTRKYENLAFDKREKWFGTEYTSIPMPAKWKTLWDEAETKAMPDLFLPDPNRFVTQDFTLFWQEAGKPDVPEAPKRLLKTDVCELFFRADDHYGLPEAFMLFYFISPLPRQSVKNDTMCSLYEVLVNFFVSEELYPATSAGFSYSFNVSDKGLILQVHGYNEKLHLLVETIAQAMVTVSSMLNQEMFDTFITGQRKSYGNTLFKPRALNRDVRLSVVEHIHWLMIDKYKSLTDITLEDLQEFARIYPKELYVQGLVQGNYTEESARNVMNTLLTCLDCKPIKEQKYVEDRTVQLPQGAHYIRCHSLNDQDTNTVITNYYQIGPNVVRVECILDLLMMFVEEPLFAQLRTKEQLGYHVDASVRMNYGIAGYSIKVNSQETNTTASHVEKRIEVFRSNMLQILKDMSQEDYDHNRDSLIKLKQLTDMALRTEVNRNWAEIVSQQYLFDRRRQQVEILRNITKDEIIAFLIENEMTNLRKLSVQVIGHQPVDRSQQIDKMTPNTDVDVKMESDSNGEDDDEDNILKVLDKKLKFKLLPEDGDAATIVDIAEFKSNLDLYPMHPASTDEVASPRKA